jgi:hypothetical protein
MMGIAYYIVLNNDEPGFDTFVNGKAVARCVNQIDAISKKIGLPKLDDFVGMSSDDISDIIGEDLDISEQEGTWFTIDEGIKFLDTLEKYIQENPIEVKDSEAVLEDLEQYLKILSKARSINAKWHFNIDI